MLADWTPLGDALMRGDETAVASLLKGGASPNERWLDARRKGRGFAPLEYAVYRDFGAAVALLLAAGADETKEFDSRGQRHTALSFAEARHKTAALQALQTHAAAAAASAPARGGKGSAVLARGSAALAAARASGTDAKPKSPQMSTKSPQTSQQWLTSQQSSGRGSAGGAPSVSPRTGPKNAAAAINYGELKLGEEIGKGAYGRVVKALYGDRAVACKVMSLDMKDEKEQEQLRREIQLQFTAKHPHIVEMIGISKDPDRNLVIVLELVEGPGDLLALLKNAAVTIDWPTRVRMARELSSAVAFMHGRNVLHRGTSVLFFSSSFADVEQISSRRTFSSTMRCTSNCAILGSLVRRRPEAGRRPCWARLTTAPRSCCLESRTTPRRMCLLLACWCWR